MMFFEKLVLAMLTGVFATALAACSNDPEEGTKATEAKQGPEAACEHINDVCATEQGYETQDCGSATANYAKLSDAEKAQADALMPCVMSATSCQSAITCLRPQSNASTAKDEDEPPAYEAEEACEHINDVCEKEEGFETQDCSSSNAEYEKLSNSDKELADDIAVCIMKAKSCKNAFRCLQFE